MALTMRERVAAYAAQKRSQPDETLPIAAAIDAVVEDPGLNDCTFFERLQRRVGLGDKPELRRKLFRLLDRLHHSNPDLVERCCCEVWASAVGARFPGRYFCVGIKRRLLECGIHLDPPEGRRYEPI